MVVCTGCTKKVRRWHMPGKWMSLSGLTRSRAWCTFCITALTRACVGRMFSGNGFRTRYSSQSLVNRAFVFALLRQARPQRVCLEVETVQMLFAEMELLAGGSPALQFSGMCTRLKFRPATLVWTIADRNSMYLHWRIVSGASGERLSKLCWEKFRCLRSSRWPYNRGGCVHGACLLGLTHCECGSVGNIYGKGPRGKLFPGPCQSQAS
jgi:hypothetical protein